MKLKLTTSKGKVLEIETDFLKIEVEGHPPYYFKKATRKGGGFYLNSQEPKKVVW